MLKGRLRIDELLRDRGRSAYWLARQIGMGDGNLYKYRKGQMKSISLDLIVRLCTTLECAPGDLIEIVESTPLRKREARAPGRRMTKT